MDQRSDYIRQDIESTRASLDEKLDSLETKARQAFDIKHQVAEKPWMMLGAAVAAGYVLGSLGGSDEADQRWHGQPATTTDYNQHASYSQPAEPSSSTTGSVRSAATSFLSEFDEEIDMLKVAAVNMLTNFLHDTVREYVPALSQQLDKQTSTGSQPRSSSTVSTAPGVSRYAHYDQTGAGATSVNTEAIPTTTSYGSNMVDRDAEHATPYYPPGSAGNRERSVGDEKTPY